MTHFFGPGCAGPMLLDVPLRVVRFLAAVVASCVAIEAAAKPAAAPLRVRNLTLVSYSVTKEAYGRIIPKFQAQWRQRHNEDVKIAESYGASASQAQAVIEGLDADVVHLAMETDVATIAQAGLIRANWRETTPNNGIPARSLIVIAVRPGNPKGVGDWADLARPGMTLVTPNPKTSGGARWNLLAAYGAVTLNGGDDAQAYRQTLAFYRNTVVLDKSARDATNTFLKKGVGDAAALWESDALLARAQGEAFDIIIPQSSILAETAVSTVDKVIDKKGTRGLAEAFVAFIMTPIAQEAFAQAGLRPVAQETVAAFKHKYPMPAKKAFTIKELGGWAQVQPKFFGKGGVYERIEMDAAIKK